jgi:hypothetical protein
MKKPFHIYFLTIFILFSCSNENNVIDDTENPTATIGMPKKIYIKINDESEFLLYEYIFDGNKIYKIITGNNDEISTYIYEGNLIKAINNVGTQSNTKQEYIYDNSLRLKESLGYNSNNQLSSKTIYTYINDNSIIEDVSIYNFNTNNWDFYSNKIFFLNPNNQKLSEDVSFRNGFEAHYDYLYDNNLSPFSNILGAEKFYDLNFDPFQYSTKYNILKQTITINNLIADYNFINTFNSQNVLTQSKVIRPDGSTITYRCEYY